MLHHPKKGGHDILANILVESFVCSFGMEYLNYKKDMFNENYAKTSSKNIYKMLLNGHLEYSFSTWSPKLKENNQNLEPVTGSKNDPKRRDRQYNLNLKNCKSFSFNVSIPGSEFVFIGMYLGNNFEAFIHTSNEQPLKFDRITKIDEFITRYHDYWPVWLKIELDGMRKVHVDICKKNSGGGAPYLRWISAWSIDTKLKIKPYL
jgi:hypothetical protein